MNVNISTLKDRNRSNGHVKEESGDGDPDKLLVLDAHKNAAVVFSRALAKSEANVEITVGGWSVLSPGMLSRYTSERFLHSSPYQQPEQFLSELREHLWEKSYLAVVPMSDLSHVLLSKHKDDLEETGTAVGTETWERFVAANNKKSLAASLDTHSIRGPKTIAPESLAEVAEIKDEFSYPVLIKPQYTTVNTEDGTYTEARISEDNYVEHPDELASSYRSLLEESPYLTSDPPIIQEVIDGTVMATCGVASDGEFIESFQEERLRMYPVGGGSSALREGIYHPEMAESAREVVDALEWTGPIYIEFVNAPADGCYVIEVNGRYWGSVGCAICGGVNVPLIHYRQLKGIEHTPSGEYQLGRQQRRLFYTDIKWLLAQLQDGNVGALSPFLRSFFEAEHDILNIDDPLPVAGSVGWALQELLQKNGPLRSPSEGNCEVVSEATADGVPNQ